MRLSAASFDGATIIEVIYPGDAHIGLRGSRAPLSWEQTREPDERGGERHLFILDVPRGETIELKVVRDDEDWAAARNYAVHAGDHLRIEPYFDRATTELLPLARVGDVSYEVLLPPSYREQINKRHPVLYALDGQALFSTSKDPYGIWSLDKVLDGLFDLGAMEELIVVAIHTAERRLERLSPVADPTHGGGEAPAFLAEIVEHLKPAIDSTYRTLPDESAILGSSMGGLFAFYAAWTRPEVFGRAACLSSSFWWANRFIVRAIEKTMPARRPTLYLDSGAARDPLDTDPHARDGMHHTRSMFRALAAHGYEPGIDLHRLVFPGHAHEPAAWGSRVGVPLQLLFPPTRVTPPRHVIEEHSG